MGTTLRQSGTNILHVISERAALLFPRPSPTSLRVSRAFSPVLYQVRRLHHTKIAAGVKRVCQANCKAVANGTVGQRPRGLHRQRCGDTPLRRKARLRPGRAIHTAGERKQDWLAESFTVDG